MSPEIAKGIDEIEARFLYDVTKVTVALFYLLQGMEIISKLYPDPVDDEQERGLVLAGPSLAGFKTFPSVSTVGEDMLGPTGVATQLAFKAWVTDICDKWEKSRHKTRELIGDDGIPVEVGCMGDFRHIRNDLVHSGQGTKEHSGKCKVLKWFKPGDKMLLTTDHVLDFLNHMNLIAGPTPISNPAEGWSCCWNVLPDAMESTMLEEDLPPLISIRMDVDADGEEVSQRQMLSCVFADGVFGQGEVEVPVTEQQYLEGTLDKDGNIGFVDGHVLSARKLYDACQGFLRGDVRDGPGILGPRANYTRD